MAGVISPISGTRTEPLDSYIFTRGTTAVFKSTFTSNDAPVTADVGTSPVARILAPVFISASTQGTPQILATLTGSLVAGQQYEYEFSWDIPASSTPLDEYIITYDMTIGGMSLNFGDEFFTITATPQQIGLRNRFYATVDDVRKTKFNIDDYLPKAFAKDVQKRNDLIEYHLKNGTQKLREELNLHKSRSMSENYRLFTVYYTIYMILLSSRGEDGSSVSDQNLIFWRREYEKILEQEKRESVMQGVPMGRA